MKLRYSYADVGPHPVLGRAMLWRQEAIGSESERYQRYVCNTLSAVAQTVGDCDRLLSYIERVKQGEPEYVDGGNDVTLTIRKSGVQVDIEINQEWVGQREGQFSLREFASALDGWKRFLQLSESANTVIEVDL